MRRFAEIYGLAVVVLVAVTPVHAVPVDFFATLSGAAENPANSSPAASDLATHLLHVQASFSGLIGTTTASHIHCCATPPTNPIVATTTPTFPDFPLGVTSGTSERTLDTSMASSFNSAFITAHGEMVASAEAALFAGMLAGQSYLNIHTTESPGGEIRGLLLTPEAGTVVLLGLGLAGLALLLKRRRRGR
jgi:CHRD domain/PEP-CTERM motif